MVKEALNIEKMFSENDYKGRVTTDGFMLERGNRSILILATHSVRSMIDGEVTEPERFTGAMAILLARLSDASSITKITLGEDVDLIKDSKFKSYIISFTKMNKIRYIINIRGIDSDDFIDIETANGLNVSEVTMDSILRNLNNRGIHKVYRNGPLLKATSESVLDACRNQCRSQIMQIGVGRSYRDIDNENNWDNFERLMLALSVFLDDLNS